MTDIQEQHLAKILNTTNSLLNAKYRKGAAEHKSTLNEDYTATQLLDMAIDEAIDQVTYLLTLKGKI
jgi:hypothetical protein